MRKLVLILAVFLSLSIVAVGAAFFFREDLARFAAGRFLRDGDLTLTHLQGMQVSSTRLSIAELEFLLRESAQRLIITDLDVGFRVTSLSAAPVVDSVTVGAAHLVADASLEAQEADNDTREGLQLSEVLTLLRDFPLARIAINELRIPQRSEPLSFELQRGEGALNARVDSGALSLQADFTQADAAGEARLSIALARAGASVGAFDVSLIPVDEVYALAGTGTLDIVDLNALLGELQQAPLPIPLRSARLDWDLAGAVADDIAGMRNSTEPQTFVLGLQAGSRVQLPAELASGLDDVALEFTERMELTVTSGAGLTLSDGRLPVRVTTTWNEQAAVVDAVLSISNCELATDGVCAARFNGSAQLGERTFAGTIDALARGDATYELETQGLTLGGLPEWLPGFDVNLAISVDEEAIHFTTPLLVRGASASAGIELAGNYARASGTASLRATLPELSFAEDKPLSTYFSNWPFTFDALAGAMAAHVELTWEAGALRGTASGKLQELGGYYGDFFFRGMNGDLRAAIDTSAALPIAMPLQTLTMAGIDVGVPMENLRLEFSVDPAGVVHIENFSSELLDGTITGENITYDINRERNDVRVQFSGLQIERMLELIEYKGVEASGAVSGAIPLTLTPDGVEVAEGVLAADAPGGSIRYLAANAGATGNAGLDLMHQALGNYQYETLTSGIEYTPDGELLLEMKLQGHNPDMNNGQRINLNLNISDNIPALLESLQAARKIEDFLEEQYTQ